MNNDSLRYKNYIFVLTAGIVIASIGLYLVITRLRQAASQNSSPIAISPTPAPSITFSLPASGSIVSSPLLVRGQVEHSDIKEVVLKLYDGDILVKEVITEVQRPSDTSAYIQTTLVFDNPGENWGYLEVSGQPGSPLTPQRIPVYFSQPDSTKNNKPSL